MSRSVIVSGARTPMGRLLGSLKDFSAADLGAVAIKAALERAGISGDQVDYVIMGQVLQAVAGADPARPPARPPPPPPPGAAFPPHTGLPTSGERRVGERGRRLR